VPDRDVRVRPDSDATGDFSTPNSLSETLGEHHEKSLHSTDASFAAPRLLSNPRTQVCFERLLLWRSSRALQPLFQAAESDLVDGCRRLYGNPQLRRGTDARVGESTPAKLSNRQRCRLKERFGRNLDRVRQPFAIREGDDAGTGTGHGSSIGEDKANASGWLNPG